MSAISDAMGETIARMAEGLAKSEALNGARTPEECQPVVMRKVASILRELALQEGDTEQGWALCVAVEVLGGQPPVPDNGKPDPDAWERMIREVSEVSEEVNRSMSGEQPSQQEAVDQTINHMMERLTGLETDVRTLKADMAEAGKRMDLVQATTGVNTESLGKASHKFAAIEADLIHIKRDLAEAGKRIAQCDDRQARHALFVAKQEGRIDALEKRADESEEFSAVLDRRIESIETSSPAHHFEDRLDLLERRIKALESTDG